VPVTGSHLSCQSCSWAAPIIAASSFCVRLGCLDGIGELAHRLLHQSFAGLGDRVLVLDRCHSERRMLLDLAEPNYFLKSTRIQGWLEASFRNPVRSGSCSISDARTAGSVTWR
jgi:hypothetical protein